MIFRFFAPSGAISLDFRLFRVIVNAVSNPGIIIMGTEIRNSAQLAEIVRNTRKVQHATQVQISQLSNVGVRFVRDLEDGKPTLQLNKVMRVLETLGIAVILSPPGDES